MVTATFTSPLSFYTVNTYFGEDALFLQPEERIMAAYADIGSNSDTIFDGTPFPYFGDVPAGGIAGETPIQAAGNGSLAALSDTGGIQGSLTATLAGMAAQAILPTPPPDRFQVPSSARDELFGTPGDDTLAGGPGHDVLTGGAGSDTFIFNRGDGRDTVTDFDARGTGHDVIDLGPDHGNTFAELEGLARQHGDDVVLNFGHGDSLTLLHVGIHDLHRADFIL